MAAIDKIYGTALQRRELGEWLKSEFPNLLKYLSPLRWWIKTEWRQDDHWISSFPVWADVWLARHCPLEWVLEALRDQYGGELPTSKNYLESITWDESDIEVFGQLVIHY